MNVVNLVRFTLGFVWIYQGLFPKILTIAPLEWQLSSSIGLSAGQTFWFIKLAGVSEIIFGVLIICFYKSALLMALNIVALIGLIIFTGLFMPAFLIEAFNPVSTNIPCITLGLYLLICAKERKWPPARDIHKLQ